MFTLLPVKHNKSKPSLHLVLRRGNQLAIPLTESLPRFSIANKRFSCCYKLARHWRHWCSPISKRLGNTDLDSRPPDLDMMIWNLLLIYHLSSWVAAFLPNFCSICCNTYTLKSLMKAPFQFDEKVHLTYLFWNKTDKTD